MYVMNHKQSAVLIGQTVVYAGECKALPGKDLKEAETCPELKAMITGGELELLNDNSKKIKEYQQKIEKLTNATPAEMNNTLTPEEAQIAMMCKQKRAYHMARG